MLPSVPPSSTYGVSNAVVKGVRVALGLRDAIRIKFDDWGNAAPLLAKWCNEYSHTYVSCMQLRKERRAPFFHEYIAFGLRDMRGYFRIDRRQLPNEGSPLDCKENGGVEAYETIQEIKNLEDSSYNASDCLVQIDFQENVPLGLIIDICREIAQHELSYVYTVQRYNCYFYAQTILLCTLCKEYDWYQAYIWGSGNAIDDPEEVMSAYMPLANLAVNPRIKIRILDKQQRVPFTPEGDITYYSPETLSLAKTNSAKRAQRKGSQAIVMKEVTIGELQGYLSSLIRTHSLQVQRYKLLLKCNAVEVERDIKQTVNRIWGKRWLLLGQVDMTLVPVVTRDPIKRRPGKKLGGWDERDLDMIGREYESGLRRRSRVKPRKRGTVA
ncbi:unnamed protein product [Rhizoctonia solani]|uniref:Uncharacterized protein n=2 Tax=Rhizoctonia solani TaxID=456999 RepID=A0A8H3BYZ3_9AGAM|nr:hypothetical protein RSOL_163470 [Rhizoctonia solani AG-3 Rhs1AP]CAE6459336.1 unnamed protein product [Rhizoctonia solani]CAE6467314.1 unnamed protein product [Rhizoctonia solani]